MYDLIVEHWDSILFVLIFVAFVIFLLLKGKKKIVYKMLYSLVTEAEKKFGSGTGSVKFAYVVQKIYSYMPGILKLFITYDSLAKMIEKALVKAKEIWAEEAGIKVYINEQDEKKIYPEDYPREGAEDWE